MEKGYLETNEKISLNGRVYCLYKDEKNGCKCIRIHGLFYPQMTELQESFHYTYKPRLVTAAMGLASITGIVIGSLLANHGLENITSDVPTNDYLDLATIGMGVFSITYGVKIAGSIVRGHNPYKK